MIDRSKQMQISRTTLTAAMLAFTLAGCETFAPDAPPAAEIQQDAATLANATNVVVLVRTQQEANRLLVNAARRGYQLNERTDLRNLEMTMLDFERPKGVSGAVAISDMTTMEPGASAGLEHIYKVQGDVISSPAATPRLYAQSMLAWPEDGCKAQIRIGMIDGNVDASSAALQGTRIIKQDFSDGSAGASAHGTAIADLLVGAGRLKEAELYSAAVVNADDARLQGAGVPEVIRAIDWMQGRDVQLVNISLAGPYNALLDRVVQRATSKGMIMIAAVGNDGPDAAPRYPAAFDDVIAVTAIDRARNVYERAVRGDHVDFSAPGVDVFVNNGGEFAQYLSGTSVAAPFVTALIASDASLSSEGNIEALRRLMGSEAVDLGEAGNDPVYGHGLVRSDGHCAASD